MSSEGDLMSDRYSVWLKDMSTFAIRHKFISFAFQMAVIKVPIQEFLQLAQSHPVLDVRSPGEYQHAHIPDAVSFPLFSDEERKEVGTAYKQVSREEAIKIGLDFFGPKMRSMVEQAEKIVGNWQMTVSIGFIIRQPLSFNTLERHMKRQKGFKKF